MVGTQRRLHTDAEKSKYFLCDLQMLPWFLTVTREYSEIGPTVTFKDKANSKQPRLLQTNYYRHELSKRLVNNISSHFSYKQQQKPSSMTNIKGLSNLLLLHSHPAVLASLCLWRHQAYNGVTTQQVVLHKTSPVVAHFKVF